jgi:hypothetical protein
MSWANALLARKKSFEIFSSPSLYKGMS